MGGPGSGNTMRWGTRATCESFRGTGARLSWNLGGEPAGSIWCDIHDCGMELTYRSREPGSDEWRDVRELIPFTYTSQKLGGRRLWFECKSCRRRCAVLYGGSRYRCRKCWGLAYQSQREEVQDRLIRRARKLRRRYGGSECLDEPFPDKPKGRHWAPYERAMREADALELAADRLMLRRWAGMLAAR